jgi:hypothetical protein
MIPCGVSAASAPFGLMSSTSTSGGEPRGAVAGRGLAGCAGYEPVRARESGSRPGGSRASRLDTPAPADGSTATAVSPPRGCPTEPPRPRRRPRARRRSTRPIRARGRGRQAGVDVLGRDAPTPRPCDDADRLATSDLPRRAHNRARPARRRQMWDDIASSPRPASRSSSPPSTSTRPTSSPIGSPSSTTAASSPRAPPTS